MARYILDSDILDYLENQDSPFHVSCVDRFIRRMGEDFCLSILTIYEMDYRIEAADKGLCAKLKKTKDKALENFSILPLTLAGSRNYGKLKAAYKSNFKAKPKAMRGYTVDIILAATALEHDAIVVSNDRLFSLLREIEPNLQVENWAGKSG